MHNMKILNSKQTKEIKRKIEEQWGVCPEMDYVFLRSNKGKIYVVTRAVADLPDERLRIDTLGLYFCEVMGDDNLRLSVEGAQIVGKVATKNLMELSINQMEMWARGMDVPLEDKSIRGFFILRHDADILGCGYCKEGVISNYVPKNRRLREVNPTHSETTDDEEF